MKTSFFSSILCFILLVFCFSCSDESDIYSNNELQSYPEEINTTRAYPSSETWWNTESVFLKSGDVVATPWASVPVQTGIPKEIREDIAPKDGWVFVYTNLQGQPIRDNYIIFYNMFTGILKGFYFLEEAQLQNNGIWKIEFEGSHKLLNGIDYFTIPLVSEFTVPTHSSVLNITTTTENRGFDRGWNCFQTPLTFDPNYNLNSLKLKVSPYNNNSAQIRLTGELSTASSGSIISTSSPSGLLTEIKDGVITQTATEGTNWLQSKITSGVIKKPGANIITGGVPSIISYGLNAIFGSFFGKSSTTESKLEFNTKGSIETTGDINSVVQGIFSPLANIPIDTEQRLGVWNLEKQPHLKFDTKAYYMYTASWERPVQHYYERYWQIEDVVVKFNPFIEPLIERYQVKTELFYYNKFNGSTRVNGDDFTTILSDISHTLIYQDENNEFYGPLGQIAIKSTQEPISDPNYAKKFIHQTSTVEKKGIVKVTVTLYPKAPYDTAPIVTTKTFIPKQTTLDLHVY